MKHKNFKDRAELLEAAAASIRMQEAAGVEPMCKHCSLERLISETSFMYHLSAYEFPLAVVEGKQVWEGDELYTPTDGKQIAVDRFKYTILFSNGIHEVPHKCSWNPPKPKTVMVELLEEDAMLLRSGCAVDVNALHRIQYACAHPAALVKPNSDSLSMEE